MTDDEKFLVEDGRRLDETSRMGYENALDLIALGFKPENTFIIYDVKDIDLLYDIALEVAKRVTYSTAKATFGFQESTNLGWVFWPAVQSVPCFIHKKLTGENVPALIPAAIDQDPFWRITRDVASKLGYFKPAQIHNRFLPGLGIGGKMSASEPDTAIFTIDSPEVVKRRFGKPLQVERVQSLNRRSREQTLMFVQFTSTSCTFSRRAMKNLLKENSIVRAEAFCVENANKT
jgi:tryptophanyl-tRNA synthetase